MTTNPPIINDAETTSGCGSPAAARWGTLAPESLLRAGDVGSVIGMASNSNDVFKFVAVRPVQLASDDDTRVDVLRDPRVADARTLAALVKAAAANGSPAAALRRWAELDLTPFRPLAAGRQRLVQDYAGLDVRTTRPPPPGCGTPSTWPTRRVQTPVDATTCPLRRCALCTSCRWRRTIRHRRLIWRCGRCGRSSRLLPSSTRRCVHVHRAGRHRSQHHRCHHRSTRRRMISTPHAPCSSPSPTLRPCVAGS
jgi:hypothetical protein